MNDNIVFSLKENSTISITMTGICHHGPNYLHFKRKPAEYILYYILDGEFFLREGEKEYHLVENDFLLMDPSRVHYGIKPSECKFMYFHFLATDGKGKSSICEGDGATNSIVIPKYIHFDSASENMDIRTLGGRLTSIYQERRPYYMQMCATLLQEILLIAASEFSSKTLVSDNNTSKSAKLIPEVIYYLNKNYASEISSESLSENFDYNFDYLNRCFKAETGQTIFNYLNSVRIERAKSLISTGLYSLSDVAASCGFSDVYYFNRVFKKFTGITPGKYR